MNSKGFWHRRTLAPILRGLGLLAFCAMGAVAFDFVLKPHRPPAPPKTASLTPTSPKRADPPSLPKWLDDLRAAKAVAKAEHKDILLEFARPVAGQRSGNRRKRPQ